MNKSIVHLSDTHFGTENELVMKAVVQAVSRLSPELVVVSGDLTQRARRSQFHRAREFLGELRVRTNLVIPGNHDIPLFNVPLRFLSPYSHYQAFFPEREAVVSTENLIVAGIDATTPFLHTRGRLGLAETRERLEVLSINRQPTKLLGLVIHQPVVVQRESDLKNLLINSAELCRLFSEFNVDFILSGHIHFPLICSVNRFVPSLPWAPMFSGAGTALSHRVRDNIPNSFNSLTFHSSGMETIIERYDFSLENNEFVVADLQRFLRSTNGWCSTDA